MGLPNFKTDRRTFAVYVSRDERIITNRRDYSSWALYASTYVDEDEARDAVMRALNQGYKHAEVRITQRFTLADDND